MLGLNIQQLQTLSPEQQFLQMAQAISKVQDPSRQAALAMELFGRSGTQLLPMLQQGEAGIEALIAEARRLGIVMSEEDAKAAAEFTDAMNRLSSVFKGIATQVASVITPILTKLSNLFTSLDKGTRGLIVQIGLFGAAFLAAIYIIPKVIAIFKMLIGAYRALTTAQVVQQAFSGPKGWLMLAAGAAAAAAGVALVANAMSDVNSEIDNLNASAARTAANANRPPTNVNVVNNDEIDNADARAKYLNNQRRIEDEIKGLRGDAKSQAILKVARLL
jgi:phage-related protein